ncbi:RICIN domain-containing protein [Catenuloplanes indicus]|uniref:Serine/threonine-protein kinase n=1 Tax=Catenuloplanes indicus TaxID=137267 RepID=A0AAE3VVM2_9ACTN|nr:ricin-type beta-trefoil lectin domain protein [Catenuloplanes indicus]MDQ0364437.1 serine/threonine-protein kinase [Catenuloplanes indicus]
MIVTRIVALCALVIGGLLVTASPAAAYTLVGRFQSHQSGLCLDSGFPAPGSVFGSVYTLPCQSGNNYQTWEVYGPKGKSRFGYELAQIKNRATGMCLNMDEYGGPRLYTHACSNGQPPDTDVLEGVGSNWQHVTLRQEFYEGRLICLDTHGSAARDAYARACNYGSYQVWRLLI